MRTRLEGHLWLAVAIGAASLVLAAYLLTHTHPAYEGGFYLKMSEAIRQGGWSLPKRVADYTAGGIPFAYPPLMFYVVALLTATTGVDPVALELYLPGLISIADLLPYWLVARKLLPSGRQAGLATVLYAVTPEVLQWHISAGGIVRSPAMFLTLAGLYTGIQLFETGKHRWLLTSTVLFGLVILSHPVYAAFFGLSYLVFYICLDRSVAGMGRGAVVAIGGIAVAGPWWLTVIDRHGPDILFGAMGTRTTIGGGASRVAQQFGYPIAAMDPLTPFYIGTLVGGIYALTRRRFLLPIWLIVASYGLGEDRFTFVAGSMLSAIVLFELVLPNIEARIEQVEYRRAAVVGVLVLVVLGTGAVGAAYAGSALDVAYEHSTTMPQTVDADDQAAMAWAAGNTSPSAEFAIVGDAAEWFPYYADRTILISPWGTEWTSPAEFRLHLARYVALSSCESVHCLERALRGIPGEAEYIYVPTEDYTIRGREHGRPGELLESLDDSPHFERRYENDAIVIFRDNRSAVDASDRAVNSNNLFRKAPYSS